MISNSILDGFLLLGLFLTFLGQVYKATLKDGREVAIKVQRPEVLGEIALDLYLLRLLAPLQVTISEYCGWF